jgi:hypothetical protein
MILEGGRIEGFRRVRETHQVFSCTTHWCVSRTLRGKTSQTDTYFLTVSVIGLEGSLTTMFGFCLALGSLLKGNGPVPWTTSV